jgi:tetratricopeptide (TPR) repeat protein
MFSGEDTLQVLSHVREARFKPPENIIDCKHSELFKILNRALAKDPDQRYASSGEMLSDIEKLLLRLSDRPTPQSISRYMHMLFGDEIKSEELVIRKVMQVNTSEEQENQEQISPDAERASTDSAQLGAVVNRTGTDQIYEATDVVTTVNKFSKFKKRKLILAGIVAGIIVIFIGYISSFWRPFFSDSQDIDSGKNGTTQLEAGMVALDEKHYSQAIDLFELILSENPSMKEAVLKPYTKALLGKASKMVQSDPEKAEKLLLRAVEFNPESVEGFFQLGLLYVGQENYNQAIIQYNKAAELNPRYPNTYYNLGYIYAKTKNYSKAEEMFERTVALAPPFIDEALFNLAVVQEKIGKLDKGITSLEQALEANPDNPLAKKYLERLKKK